MKKYAGIILLICLLSSCCARKSGTASGEDKLRACPDEWIENRMPSVGSTGSVQYFILEGKRRELSEFDLDWIKQHCNLKPTIVY